MLIEVGTYTRLDISKCGSVLPFRPVLTAVTLLGRLSDIITREALPETK